MLKRKMMEKLESWKCSKKNKCLLIMGARQVGKTFIIREFCRENYESVIELNFIEREDIKNIFDDDLSPETIYRGIRLYMPDAHFVPGKTALFLDEIQECEKAVSALKFLAQDETVDVYVSGSLLGIQYKNKTSFPVGYVDFETMYSLDFEEFLWAMGVDEDIYESLGEYFRKAEKVPWAVHDRMNRYLSQYLVLGGMPEVVNVFAETQDYSQADRVQRNLYQSYLLDIARYADAPIKIKAESCYKSIPMQLVKDNHKFQYKVVEKGGNAKKFGSSLDWLASAQIVIPVFNVAKVEYPLKSFAKEDNLRLYPNDIGLLICTYGFEMKRALLNDTDIEDPGENILLKTVKGGICEALAADMLKKTGIEQLYFYRNDDSTIEMEFLIEGSDGVVPIEVKAGRTGTKSLNKLLKSEDILYGYKAASQNVGQAGKKITIPMYMLPFVRKDL